VAAAKKLGTTQASISHYLYSKRGEKMVKQLEDTSAIKAVVAEIAEGIANEKLSPFDSMLQFCKLCAALRSGDLMSEWYKSHLTFRERCNVCPPTAKKHC
jgi:predicted transcriptional regulator